MGRYWSPKRLYLPLLRPSKHSWDKHAPVVTSKFALQLCSWGWIRHLTPLQIWLILDCIYYPALSRSARCELLKFPPFTSCQYDKQPAGSLQGPALPFSLMGQARPNPRNSVLTTVQPVALLLLYLLLFTDQQAWDGAFSCHLHTYMCMSSGEGCS